MGPSARCSARLCLAVCSLTEAVRASGRVRVTSVSGMVAGKAQMEHGGLRAPGESQSRRRSSVVSAQLSAHSWHGCQGSGQRGQSAHRPRHASAEGEARWGNSFIQKLLPVPGTTLNAGKDMWPSQAMG